MSIPENIKSARNRKKDRPGEPLKAGTGGSFATAERTPPNVTSLAGGRPADTVPTLRGGFATLSDEDFDRLCNMSADELIDVCEQMPANTPGLPGTINVHNSDIARDYLASEYVLFRGEVESSTGSWGSRNPGEGAVACHVTFYREGPSDYPGTNFVEQDYKGTMTIEDVADGSLLEQFDGPPADEGWEAVVEVDIDFKAAIREHGENGTINEFMHVLEDAYNEGAEYRWRRDMNAPRPAFRGSVPFVDHRDHN